MTRDKLFPLCDHPFGRLGRPVSTVEKQNLRAQWTGEFRKPRKGEWFLSGAIIGAHYAANDLPMAYNIAEIVMTKEVKDRVITEVF